MRCSKSKFPIRIIVFDELELIVFDSQGLTLSTASLHSYTLRRSDRFSVDLSRTKSDILSLQFKNTDH